MNEIDDLRDQYRNVEALFTDLSAIVPRGDMFHRPAPGGEEGPACSVAADDWRVVETDDALRLGMVPCKGCYRGAVECLAVEEPESPIEPRDTPRSDHAHGQTTRTLADGGATIEVKVPRLAARPEQVLVTSTGKETYHAPTGDGALCGNSGDFRKVDRAVLAGHAEPCSLCFEVDEIDTSTI